VIADYNNNHVKLNENEQVSSLESDWI